VFMNSMAPTLSNWAVRAVIAARRAIVARVSFLTNAAPPSASAPGDAPRTPFSLIFVRERVISVPTLRLLDMVSWGVLTARDKLDPVNDE
jgi:hypothetical protein